MVATSPIKRLAVENCVSLRGNLTDAAVQWKSIELSNTTAAHITTEEAPLAALAGKNVTLEFRLDPGAVLFAFDLPN